MTFDAEIGPEQFGDVFQWMEVEYWGVPRQFICLTRMRWRSTCATTVSFPMPKPAELLPTSQRR